MKEERSRPETDSAHEEKRGKTELNFTSFTGYSRWLREPLNTSQLDKSMTKRLPIRTDRSHEERDKRMIYRRSDKEAYILPRAHSM